MWISAIIPFEITIGKVLWLVLSGLIPPHACLAIRGYIDRATVNSVVAMLAILNTAIGPAIPVDPSKLASAVLPRALQSGETIFVRITATLAGRALVLLSAAEVAQVISAVRIIAWCCCWH